MAGQVNQFKIKNNDTGKELKFHYAESFGDSITVNNINVSSPGQTASNNFVRNFGGFKRVINVSFMLVNDGTDKSTGGDSIITLSQQWDYLMDTIIQGNSSGQSSVTYTVTIYRDAATKTFTGGIEDCNLNFNDGVRLAGSFNLTQGQ